MRFIDEARISVSAGDGGHGCVSFRREKNIPYGGPNGGNGGRGGHVIFRGDPNLATLIDFRYRRHRVAEKGKAGQGSSKTGAAGRDLILDIPLGTQIFDEQYGLLADLTQPGMCITVCQGGQGGYGNSHFKTSTRRSPRYATAGSPGEMHHIVLRLKLMADVGLVGLPNAGKSSLLANLSRARPRIAPYPFTSLHPSLGLVEVKEQSFILADLPGLIEGAHQGRGLGVRFLNHAERCHVLVHLVDASLENPIAAWHMIDRELHAHDTDLTKKPMLTLLSRSDLVSTQHAKQRADALSLITGHPTIMVSSVTQSGIEDFLRTVFALLDKKASI